MTASAFEQNHGPGELWAMGMLLKAARFVTESTFLANACEGITAHCLYFCRLWCFILSHSGFGCQVFNRGWHSEVYSRVIEHAEYILCCCRNLAWKERLLLHADQKILPCLLQWCFVYWIIKTQSQIVSIRLFDKQITLVPVSRSVSLLFVLVSPGLFSTSIISLFVSHVMLFHFKLCVTLDSISLPRFVFFDLCREPRLCTFDMHCAHVITSTSLSSSVYHFPNNLSVFYSQWYSAV